MRACEIIIVKSCGNQNLEPRRVVKLIVNARETFGVTKERWEDRYKRTREDSMKSNGSGGDSTKVWAKWGTVRETGKGAGEIR